MAGCGQARRRHFWLSLLAFGSLCVAVQPVSAGIITGTFGDEVWSHDPTATGIAGGHTATASAYNYSAEQFELPVQASGWNYDGNPAATSGTLLHSGSTTTPGKYWSYIDATQAVFTADSQYWNIRISVAGDYEWAGDSGSAESPVGLKGKYYAYFGQFNTGDHYAFNIDSGTGLSTSFDTAGGVKLFEDSTDAGKTPPYGTAITTTFDDDNNEGNYSGYLSEISTSALTARTHYSAGSVYDIEFRYDYTIGPIAKSFLEDLDYLYVGVAESNPSATSALFANDHFTENGGTSAEYDTILIPEPSTGVLALLGLLCLTGRRRR